MPERHHTTYLLLKVERIANLTLNINPGAPPPVRFVEFDTVEFVTPPNSGIPRRGDRVILHSALCSNSEWEVFGTQHHPERNEALVLLIPINGGDVGLTPLGEKAIEEMKIKKGLPQEQEPNEK